MLERDRAIIHMMLETIEKIFLFTSDLTDVIAFENDIDLSSVIVKTPKLLIDA